MTWRRDVSTRAARRRANFKARVEHLQRFTEMLPRRYVVEDFLSLASLIHRRLGAASMILPAVASDRGP